MSNLLIENINFKNNETLVKYECKKVNIIVGANNSGKTTILNEISHFESLGFSQTKRINSIEYNSALISSEIQFDNNRLVKALDFFISNDGLPQSNDFFSCSFFDFNNASIGYHQQCSLRIGSPDNIKNIQSLLKVNINPQNKWNVLKNAYFSFEDHTNIISFFMNNTEKWKHLNEKLFYAIGHNIVFYGNKESVDVFFTSEKTLPDYILNGSRTPEAISFYTNKCLKLDKLSLGLQSYINILTAAEYMSSKRVVLFLDEPEQSLHSSLSKKLSTQLLDIFSHSQSSQLFISTHSPHFINGIVESSIGLNDINSLSIIKPSFKNNHQSLAVVKYENIKSCYDTPLLQLANFSECFFADITLLVEGYSDLYYYKYAIQKSYPALDVFYLVTNGKDSAINLLNKINALSVDTRLILDFDFLKKDPEVFPSLDDIRREDIKLHGLSSPYVDKDKAIKKIQDFQTQNIFIVPLGESENWFLNLINISDKKSIFNHLICENKISQLSTQNFNRIEINSFTIDIFSFISLVIS